MKRNRILVIIVTYNAMPWANRCLTSLRQSIIPCDVTIIDNGSTDGTQEYIHTYFPEIELIGIKKNLGFGQANNIGIQKAIDNNYEFVYLLNQDAWILQDTFKNLIIASEAHPEYGVLSPMQMKSDCLHFEDKFKSHIIPHHQVFTPSLTEDLYFQRVEEVYEVSFVMAAHWLITSKCLSTVGGFSPTFPHYGEDDNYLNRTNYWNFKIGIVPSARAVHDRGDNKWSAEKEMYVNDYIGSLVSFSNPLHRESLDKKVIQLLKRGICSRKMALIKYAFKLKRERNNADANYERSLKEKAFLK